MADTLGGSYRPMKTMPGSSRDRVLQWGALDRPGHTAMPELSWEEEDITPKGMGTVCI